MGLVAESISRSVIRAYQEFVVGVRVKKLYPALKHGGYSATDDGLLQEDTVRDIARWTWRKQNLGTFRIAEAARERASAIRSEMIPSTTPLLDFPLLGAPDPADVKAATEAAKAQAREELGESYKFVEMGDLATVTQMLADLEVEERFECHDRQTPQKTVAPRCRR